jgi:RNA polymerase sigma factor (sigma-70 family)
MSSEQKNKTDSEDVLPEIDEIFKLYHKIIFKRAYQFLSRSLTAEEFVNVEELAEEVAQTVFIKLFKLKSDKDERTFLRLKEEKSLLPFLMGLTRNAALNIIRDRTRLKGRKAIFEVLEDKEIINRTTPEIEFEQREESFLSLKGLQRTLNEMPELLRSCLILKLQGLSNKEIAESLSLDEAVTKAFLSKAIQQLKRHYQQIEKDAVKDKALILDYVADFEISNDENNKNIVGEQITAMEEILKRINKYKEQIEDFKEQTREIINKLQTN